MKTTKKLIVLCLALALCCCAIMPTFSWYDRSGSKNAGSFEYSDNMPAAGYNDVSFSTYKGTVDASGHNVIYNSEAISEDTDVTIKNNEAAYYKTVISSETEAKLNLYIDKIITEGNTLSNKLYIGTTSPIYNKQAYSPKSSVATRENNTIRIYFQPKENTQGGWTGSNFWLYYYDAITSRDGIKMTYCGNDNDQYGKAYYADIPLEADGFFITNIETEDANSTNRIPSINLEEKNITQLGGVVVYLTGNTTSDYYTNKEYMLTTGVDVANAAKYRDKVYADVGASEVSVALENTDYTGSSIAYSSSDSDTVAVDSNGNLTLKKAGSAVITTTITSVYSDTLKLTTEVEVVDPKVQVPIVENVTVKAGKTVEVCWFIKNETGSDVKYSIGEVLGSL